MTTHRMLLLGLTLLATPALSEPTCKLVDPDGRVIFANVPVKNARKVQCFERVQAAAPKQASTAPQKSAPPQTATVASRIESGEQARRDTERQRILQQELAEETRLLEDAKRLLFTDDPRNGDNAAAAFRALERVGPVSESVRRHERNIEALRREMSAAR
jgi:hypothetical protein